MEWFFAGIVVGAFMTLAIAAFYLTAWNIK
jgi:hypothetical protein